MCFLRLFLLLCSRDKYRRRWEARSSRGGDQEEREIEVQCRRLGRRETGRGRGGLALLRPLSGEDMGPDPLLVRSTAIDKRAWCEGCTRWPRFCVWRGVSVPAVHALGACRGCRRSSVRCVQGVLCFVCDGLLQRPIMSSPCSVHDCSKENFVTGTQARSCCELPQDLD